MTKISALRAAATAAVLGVAASAVSISAAASGPQAASPKTHPLPTAHVVQQDPSCKGYQTYSVPRVASLDPHKTYTAVMTTNKGVITLALDARHAPNTVQSFIYLADHHYFDGVSFHRVVPGFVIQGGDPTGSGLCGPGYEFGDENLNQKYVRGSLAMANSGTATNGSQFFIVLADQTNGLDQQPNYSLFGHVASGLKAMDAIAGVRLGPGGDGANSKPLQKVYMKTVRIVVH